MRFRKLKNVYIIRLGKGEEIVASLKELCRKEKIFSGYFHGIGAVSKAKLGFFDPCLRRYLEKDFKEAMEIVMLAGNIALKENDIVLHCHIMLGRNDYSVVGGHFFEGKVGVTCEVYLTKMQGKVVREKDEETGLSLLKL